LIIAFACCAMRYRNTAFLLCNLDLSARDDGASEGRALYRD
jgi:hypothetical protein